MPKSLASAVFSRSVAASITVRFCDPTDGPTLTLDFQGEDHRLIVDVLTEIIRERDRDAACATNSKPLQS